jgi:hypothetical protein
MVHILVYIHVERVMGGGKDGTGALASTLSCALVPNDIGVMISSP